MTHPAIGRITKEVEYMKSLPNKMQVVSWNENNQIDVKFRGPVATKYDEWYDIQITLPHDYPFKPCSIVFTGNRPKHWFYWKKDNLSDKQDFGLYYGYWCPAITIVHAIELINESMTHSGKFEDRMSGQYDLEYRAEVDALFD